MAQPNVEDVVKAIAGYRPPWSSRDSRLLRRT
jgi:hypothetical protein